MVNLLIDRTTDIAKPSVKTDTSLHLRRRRQPSVCQFLQSIIACVEGSSPGMPSEEFTIPFFPLLTIILIRPRVSYPLAITRQLGFVGVTLSPATIHCPESFLTRTASTLFGLIGSGSMLKATNGICRRFRYIAWPFVAVPSSSVCVFTELATMIKPISRCRVAMKVRYGLKKLTRVALLYWYTLFDHAVYACTVKV